MTNHSTQSRRQFLALAATGLAAAGMAPASPAFAAARKAPQWDISEWINGNAGNVDTLRGKVIVIDFFQLWCPGCNKFSGPLLSYWQKRFAEEIAAGRLVLVKIHTVFEGHSYQSVSRLREYIREKNITLPVGVDRHADGRRVPVTMDRYRTSGTPEMAIIDTEGVTGSRSLAILSQPRVKAHPV